MTSCNDFSTSKHITLRLSQSIYIVSVLAVSSHEGGLDIPALWDIQWIVIWNCWKRKFHACSLWTPTCHIKMGSGPGALSRPRGKYSEQPTGLWSCLRLSLPVSDTMYTPWFYLNVCVVWYMASPTTISLPWGEGMGSFCCNVKGTCADPLPCISCWEGPNVHRGPASPIEVWSCSLSFLCG